MNAVRYKRRELDPPFSEDRCLSGGITSGTTIPALRNYATITVTYILVTHAKSTCHNAHNVEKHPYISGDH